MDSTPDPRYSHQEATLLFNTLPEAIAAQHAVTAAGDSAWIEERPVGRDRHDRMLPRRFDNEDGPMPDRAEVSMQYQVRINYVRIKPDALQDLETYNQQEDSQ